MSAQTPSKLQKILASGQYAVTSEVGPPRSADGEVITHKAGLIADYVDAINVTDNQTSVCRLCSLAACIRIKQLGLEPVLQMVTRDRNRIALQSDILGAASFGINNILCLTGDHQHFGDHATAANVFDLVNARAGVPGFAPLAVDRPDSRLDVHTGGHAADFTAIASDAAIDGHLPQVMARASLAA